MTDTMTIATCNIACWMAREEDCRCSCGGVGHGVLLAGGEQPRRNRLIKGVRYVLAGVTTGWGEDPLRDWFRADRAAILAEFGTKRWDGSLSPYLPGNFSVNSRASESQSRTWPEARPVERVRFAGTAYESTSLVRPYLHWIRQDAASMFDAWSEAQD